MRLYLRSINGILPWLSRKYFFVAYHLIRLGYFLGLAKSILMPWKVVPYLGWLVDSSNEISSFVDTGLSIGP